MSLRGAKRTVRRLSDSARLGLVTRCQAASALDCAITFAPSGKVVVDALSSLRKGGAVAINAIHLNQMPAFDYDKLLWGERQIRSVANMTRVDARDFLALAHKLNIQPRVSIFHWIRQPGTDGREG